ncbi:MAG: PLP-dependent aminotransferase family protein [Solirubrobacterales bacterium]
MAMEMINFTRGAPSADILPAEAVREAAARALESDWQRALSYGTGKGHPALAEWIAGQHQVDPAQVMITNGSMDAAALLFRHLVSEGDRVIVEQPTYDRTLLLLGRAGADFAPVALEADGIDIGAVEAACEKQPTPKLAHVIPNFHNPAGCTLSLEKRRRLVELAAEHGFVLFEDDPYRLVAFEEAAAETMLDLDDAGRVIHASSFTKTVCPGIRVGYLIGPAEQIATLSKRASENYISPNMLAESIVCELCTSGAIEENIVKVNTALAERREALVKALSAKLPEAEFVVPGGGYFLWLTLGEDVDTAELLPVAKEEGVGFVAGADFMIDGGVNALRLSFASATAEQIPEGVERIARALQRVRSAAPAGA